MPAARFSADTASRFSFVFVFVLAATGPAAAQSTIPVERAVALRLQILEQHARADVALWELQAAAGAGPPPETGNSPPPPDLRRLVSEALQAAYAFQPGRPVLKDDGRVLADWTQAAGRRAAFEAEAATRAEAFGFSWADRTALPFRPGPVDGAILAWAVVALAVSLVLAAHESRVELRRARRARLPGGVAAAVAAGLFALSGCGGPPAATRTDPEGLAAELAAATTEADDATRRADARHAEAADGWAKFLSADGETPERAKLFLAKEAELLAAVRAAARAAALAARLAADSDGDGKLEADAAKLDDLTAASRWRAGAFAAARVAAAVGLAWLVTMPYRAARRRTGAARRKDAATCPRCLAVGKLEVVKVAKSDGEYDEKTYLECAACQYRIRRSHQYIPRLCFPTVGIRSSGKTHMLTTAYAGIQNRTAPSRAAVQTAPSVMDEQFRQYIDQILRKRKVAGATTIGGFVDPLLIHTRDADARGPTGVLTNLFDYSGELIEETPLAQQVRPRAMMMDGFMMFFDPTQMYGDNNNATIEDQIQALNNFYQQMAEARGLEPGTVIPNPVAICISKFDLLETANPIGGQCLPFIRELIGTHKPAGPVTLATLKARSDLVEQMLPLMFPGLNIQRLVREYFGNQMLFFPMSSLNLNIDEFGQVDTSARNPAPYGVVEPILWLMHMHGYAVLDAA